MAGEFITKDKPEKLRLLLYGESGGGKTTFAATAADIGNTLLLSFHAQPQTVSENTYKHKLVVWKLNELTDLDVVMTWLHSGEGSFGAMLKANKRPTNYKYIIFEGFTVMQRIYMQIVLRKDLVNDVPIYEPRTTINHAGRASKREWGILAGFTDELTSSFYGLHKYNVIITCHEQRLYDPPETMNDAPKLTGIRPNIQGSGSNLIISRSNILARVTWDGKDSTLRIRQSKTVRARYDFSSKMPLNKTILINPDMADLLCVGKE